ncbi:MULTISPECIES: conjugal transfer protein TraB [Rhizobium]|uniref:Conjugal transfer protein TraB n=1 Tax=Rhizobium leguminosarum bv. viciae TaxID=387 RepID=A0A8G2IUT1_RHILV|nr:conjugal transfer protein TraB [Rhizobium leguminosarum]NKK10348.1 conjugal transfer protein TraB [Rhizobium leguminosarum bv. viciae]NKK23502.1 conjugal transfer protein TraB [Rhizobium leguminosarum bv. viciae]TBX87959.1 conjugal transfer protein TraB [Rhizobium leguminosarum bv. viciae]TBY78002.1 conjugal transfer protein TraB [Rhizobium leguminosarum bv. viciae]TBZ13131.1 conjugal transfer protein TraB [Rhizobium leguminosarum bv. viciae]
MSRDYLRPALLIFASIAIGVVGWSGHVLLLPVALGFPVLWSIARTRSVAALVSAGYFLAASRGLPQGMAAFYSSDIWPGLLLWLCASLSFVVVHAVLWTKNTRVRPFRYLLAAVIMAIPPFGITGWAHPVTAAGVLFPGWGWWGLGFMTAGLAGLATRIWPAVAIAFAGLWLWSAAIWTDPKLPEGWRGVDLELGASLGREAGLQRQRDIIATVRNATSDGARYVVLPESALGYWTSTVERFWTGAFSDDDATVITGAAMVDPRGYDNVLVAIDRKGSRILYRERMPVPGSMWQPWRSWFRESGGARADFFANPIVPIGAGRAAPLICYEQLIVWPVLQSMLHNPDFVVAVGNGWWTEGTSIVSIQRAATTAWAELFAKPLVIAFNT